MSPVGQRIHFICATWQVSTLFPAIHLFLVSFSFFLHMTFWLKSEENEPCNTHTPPSRDQGTEQFGWIVPYFFLQHFTGHCCPKCPAAVSPTERQWWAAGVRQPTGWLQTLAIPEPFLHHPIRSPFTISCVSYLCLYVSKVGRSSTQRSLCWTQSLPL